MDALASASQACPVPLLFTIVLASAVAALVTFTAQYLVSQKAVKHPIKSAPEETQRGIAQCALEEECGDPAVLEKLQSPSAGRRRIPSLPQVMTPAGDSTINHPCTPNPPSPQRFPVPKQLFTSETEDVALIDAQLHKLLSSGALTLPGGTDLRDYVQPASIDLPLSGTVYLVKEKVLPFKKKVSELIESLTLEEKSLSGNGTVLLKGQTYLVFCAKVRLPYGSRGCLSPKSSIGRIDLRVRGVVDNSGLYDVVPGDDEERSLWLEISPRSFNVRLKEGFAITQLMVFMGQEQAERTLAVGADMVRELVEGDLRAERERGEEASLSDLDTSGILGEEEEDGEGVSTPTQSPKKGDGLELATPPSLRSKAPMMKTRQSPDTSLMDETLCFDLEGHALPLKMHKGAVVLSVCVPTSTEAIAGYEAIATEEVVDLSRIGQLDPSTFFRDESRPLPGSGRDSLTLEKDRFYILATKERVCVPVHLSAEMVPFSHHVGELRAHYAGFFDPGFGYGREGELKGTVGVLEVRPHETINIYHGQPICLMEFYRNASVPLKPYGFAGSNYQGQKGPKLAKYFASS